MTRKQENYLINELGEDYIDVIYVDWNLEIEQFIEYFIEEDENHEIIINI